MNTPSKTAPNKPLVSGIGENIDTIDHLLVFLMARRIELSKQVAFAKLDKAEPTIHLGRERARIEKVQKWAIQWDMNPYFAASLLYHIIGESCKVQIQLRDEHGNKPPPEKDETETYTQLRENLLALTQRIAPTYDKCYDRDFFATRLHLEFEHRILSGLLENASDSELIVDLGCATGREGLTHTRGPTRLVGYDISPHMIEKAKLQAAAKNLTCAEFFVYDLEQGIPLPDSSVSCVFMNHGTGSDVKNIERILAETKRVLKLRGKFLFSFYNAEALASKAFLPWPLSLAAEIDAEKHCLKVYCPGKEPNMTTGEEEQPGKLLSIYARPYTVTEVEDLFSNHLCIESIVTHPTISSILPDHLFRNPEMIELIESIDTDLTASGRNLGAYIVVTGAKTG